MSRYIGTGRPAKACEVRKASARRKREREREKLRKMQEALDEQSRPLRDFMEQVRALTHAVLLAGGFHMHNGQWRKQREQD